MHTTAPFRHPEQPLVHVLKTHRIVRVEPDNDASLRYALPIPKGWGRVTRMAVRRPSPHAPEVIGVFSPTPDLTGPRVIVSVKRLAWEVDPLAWATHGFVVGGWQIATSRWLDPPRNDRFDVGGLAQIRGHVEVRRRIGFLDNGRLFHVDVAARLEQWSSVHDLLWPCAALFQLHEPSGRVQVEAQPRYRGPGLSFCLPASWRVSRQELPRGMRWFGGVETDVQKTAALRIDVCQRDDRTPPPDVRRRAIAQELRGRGVLLAAHAELDAQDPVTGREGWGGTYRAEASMNGTPYEVRIAHLDTPTHVVDYLSVAPRPGTYHLDWMRTTRALQVAASTSRAA